jgi:hypothetical protein
VGEWQFALRRDDCSHGPPLQPGAFDEHQEKHRSSHARAEFGGLAMGLI